MARLLFLPTPEGFLRRAHVHCPRAAGISLSLQERRCGWGGLLGSVLWAMEFALSFSSSFYLASPYSYPGWLVDG